jgi:two-component system, NarL family, nitrate/nitrite response regulator NarL
MPRLIDLHQQPLQRAPNAVSLARPTRSGPRGAETIRIAGPQTSANQAARPCSDSGRFGRGFAWAPGSSTGTKLLYRQGLAASLNADGRLEVAGEAAPAEAADLARAVDSDAILLDASADVVPLVRTLRGICPHSPVIGFAISGGARGMRAGAEAGLSAFVDSEASIGDLVDHVFDALRGELNCSPKLASMICRRLARLSEQHDAGGSLTERERQVADLVARGCSNKEIARSLEIGPATVKNHVHNILDKLSVGRRAAIATRLAAIGSENIPEHHRQAEARA